MPKEITCAEQLMPNAIVDRMNEAELARAISILRGRLWLALEELREVHRDATDALARGDEIKAEGGDYMASKLAGAYQGRLRLIAIQPLVDLVPKWVEQEIAEFEAEIEQRTLKTED
jgi:hypothetical protein